MIIRLPSQFKVGLGGYILSTGISDYINDKLYSNLFLLNASCSSMFIYQLTITLKNITTPTFTS